MAVKTIPASEVETVLAARAEVGEGPLWDDREHVLWWVDIPRHAVHRLDPESGTDSAIDVARMVGAIALTAGGGLILALQDGFALYHSDQVDVITPVEADNPTTRMNDGYVDPQGRFWAGTMAISETTSVGSLYRLDPGGQVTRMLTGVGISNGIDWSPDGRTMYFADTTPRRVDAFDFDGPSGRISNRRTLIQYPAGGGSCDGLVVDAEGYLWVALWGGSAVHRYTPTGELTTVVELPVTQVTKPAFGGRDLDDLYITSARRGRHDEPGAGDLFVVRGVGVRGQRIHRFQG
ncbi:MAG: SMP-30/gluconolactonase/LRE family protein [Candidatus Dormibacteraceae bacterium]